MAREDGELELLEEACPICSGKLYTPKFNPFEKLIMIRCLICDYVVSGRNGSAIRQLLILKVEPTCQTSEQIRIPS